jgi:hypothetical protein
MLPSSYALITQNLDLLLVLPYDLETLFLKSIFSAIWFQKFLLFCPQVHWFFLLSLLQFTIGIFLAFDTMSKFLLFLKILVIVL